MKLKDRIVRGPSPPLKSVTVGNKLLIDYEGVLRLLEIDPSTEPDRPKTITVQQAIKLTSLGRRTIYRMIAAGREAPEQQDTAA